MSELFSHTICFCGFQCVNVDVDRPERVLTSVVTADDPITVDASSRSRELQSAVPIKVEREVGVIDELDVEQDGDADSKVPDELDDLVGLAAVVGLVVRDGAAVLERRALLNAAALNRLVRKCHVTRGGQLDPGLVIPRPRRAVTFVSATRANRLVSAAAADDAKVAIGRIVDDAAAFVSGMRSHAVKVAIAD